MIDDAWEQAALVQSLDQSPIPQQGASRRRLGEVLVDLGAITPEQLAEALAHQRVGASQGWRKRLGTIMVELGHITDRQIARALSDALLIPLVDLSSRSVSTDIGKLLPRRVAEQHLAVPIEVSNKRLTVAFSDPTNVIALDDVKVYSGYNDVAIVISPEGQVRDLLARLWSLSEDSAAVATMLEDLDDSQSFDDTLSSGLVDDAPTVKLVNVILADAVRARASDIHVEPQASVVRIRYRVDGLLRDVMTAPRSAAAGVISRIKVMSNLDIAERRVPQDGRARLHVDGYSVDARISTLPSLLGEKVVIRLLSKADNIPPIAKLGLDEKQLETLLGTVVAPQGLILITGPTGSGKTGTLYSAITQIKTPDRNIITLEDPVEMQVADITQVQVSERTGMTFTRGLRSVLRQDPDVVLVGEVRDAETAKLALEASLTGHMVMTTLHTNSAPAAVSRLVDMGVEPFLVASSLSLVVAQRLVRKVCSACAKPYVPSDRMLSLLGITAADLEAATPLRGTGCVECGGTGYYGRTGIFEVLPVTAHLRAVLMSTPNEGAVAAAARTYGMQTLRASAVAKARAGITTYEEVLRVTQVETTGGLQCAVCGGSLGEDMVACPWCATSVDRGHCRGCDRPLDVGWRVCPWCREAAPGHEVTAGGDIGEDAAALPRILIVDDDESIRAYVATVLSGVIDVVAVATAAEALELAGDEDFDGIVVDHRLPDLTGLELIRLLRSEARTASVPLMLFTAHGETDVEDQARSAGVDDYLVKPVEPHLLEERLLALVARSARVAA